MGNTFDTWDVYCRKCGTYMYSGSYERPFRHGDKFPDEKDQFCKKCKKKAQSALAEMDEEKG